MKKHALFGVMLISLFLPVHAGIGSNLPVEVIQPDGTTFMARIIGDEHQRWVQTVHGYTILRNEKTKAWEYAIQAKNGGLELSGKAVSSEEVLPLHIPKYLEPFRDVVDEKHTHERLQLKAGGEWDPTLVAGTRNLLFIAVGFNDRALVTNASDWDTAIFDQTPGRKTVANFYDDNSQGLLQPVPTPNSQTSNPNGGIVTVNVNLNHPNTGHSNQTTTQKYNIETQWINAALSEASAHVDFQALDTNGDGDLTLDESVVYFIVAGYDASGSTNEPNVWGHKWGTWNNGDVQVDGVEVNYWAINGELYNTGDRHSIGIITHELGHLMCSLPDLYDINPNGGNSAMGMFSLMAAGSWGIASGDNIAGDTPVNMDAWCRSVLGWANPRRPASNATVTFGEPLASANAPVMLRNESDKAYEYFLVENRVPTGWDLGMKGTLETAEGSTVSSGSTTYASEPMTYSPLGSVTATAVDCGLGEIGDFPGSVNGNIALISRGNISFVDKVINAKNAGAIAAIIYNNTGGVLSGTLGSPGDYIPAVGIAQADGPDLAGQIATVIMDGEIWNGGLLIQHVDETVGSRSANNINDSRNNHQGITVVEADPTVGSLLATSGGTSGRTRHLYYAGNNQEFSATSNPPSDYWDGSASGLGLYDISASGSTMTASMSPVSTGTQDPVASFTFSVNDLVVDFTSTSVDPDGSISSYNWSFGDGASAINQNPSHTYGSPGTYTVTLTVTDNDGLTDSTSQQITVTETVNTVTETFSGRLRGGQNATQTITVSGGAIDLSLTWQNNHNLNITLIGPSGSTVATATTNSKPETLIYDTGGTAGTYTIRIDNLSTRRNRANYTLTATYVD